MHRIKKAFVLLGGSALLGTAAVATLASPASAFIIQPGFSGATGNTGCTVNQADNASNTWYPYNLESQSTSAVNWTVKYIENETIIDEVKQSASDSNTDVIYNDGDYAHLSGPPCVSNSQWYGSPNGNFIGYTACWSTTSWGGCQQHRIYLDTAWESNNSAGWIQDLVLHESGHGLGLTHPQTCTPVCSDTNLTNEVMSKDLNTPYDYFSSNDKNLIDSNY